MNVRFSWPPQRGIIPAQRRLGHGKQPEEPVSFDQVFVLRRPPVAAFGTVKVSEAAVMVSWFAQRVSGQDGAMNADPRLRLWNLVVEHADGDAVAVKHVCTAAIELTGADNAAVTVMLSATPRETLYASDRVASELEELALILGEGPTVDALAGSPTLVADLTAPECLIRWPMYAPEAVDAGIRAVFGLPLQVGAIRLGVLDLYRVKPGGLDRDQEADALMLADTACALLLDSAECDPPRRERPEPEQASLQHPEVHQATGIIAVQLGVTAAVALIRLRAYAYTNGCRLREAAGEVVARTLRFTADGDDAHTNGGPGDDGSHGGADYGT